MPQHPPLTESYVFNGQIFLPGLTDYPDDLAAAIERKNSRPETQDSVFYKPPTQAQINSVTPVGLSTTLSDPQLEDDEDDTVQPVVSATEADQTTSTQENQTQDDGTQTAQPDPTLVDNRIPFFQELINGGITTIQDLYNSRNNLTAISGIGEGRAAQINKWIDENVVVQ